MKISKIDDFMHVLESFANTKTILKNIASLNEKEDTFYVCNISDIVQKFQLCKALLPRVELYYEVKCNNSLMVLEVMAALGSGFSCATKRETNQVLMMGVCPDRIISSNPAIPAGQIKHAASAKVSLITFDSSNELHKIKRLCPDAKLVILIRCGPEDTESVSGISFGCNPTTEAPELLKLAYSLDLTVVGVSFYVEPDHNDIQFYNKAIKAARTLFDIGSALGYNFEVLNLGSEFPPDNGNSSSMRKIADEINSALEFYFPDPSVRVIIKPSQFLVHSAFKLVCKINLIRIVDKLDPTTGDLHPHHMYFISDGVYGSFNSALYCQQDIHPMPLKERPMSKMVSSSIWGPICDKLDQIVEEVVLPEMIIGDWIIFENMGAYTLSMSSPLNGFPTPMLHITAEESTWDFLRNSTCQLTEDHFVMGNQSTCGLNLGGPLLLT